MSTTFIERRRPRQPYLDLKPFGVRGDGVWDDQPGLQAALNELRARGGGTLYLPGPATYLLDTVPPQRQGVRWHLEYGGDHLTVECAPGAKLKSTKVAGAGADVCVFAVGGWAKPGAGMADWPTAANYFVNWPGATGAGETVYTMTPAAKGAMQIALATPAQAANFAPGDYIFIRSGQTIDQVAGLTGVTEPDSELNRVLSADQATGVIQLVYPLAKAYAQEYFIAGSVGRTSTTVTANPAPFGVSKVTSKTSRKIAFRGVNVEGPGNGFLFCQAWQVDGLYFEDCDVEGIVFARAGFSRDIRVRRNRCWWNGRNAYAIGLGTGDTDVSVEDNDFGNAGGICELHAHEGVARSKVRRNTVYSKPGLNTAGVTRSVGIVARAYDQLWEHNTYINGPADSTAFYVDTTSPGGDTCIVRDETFLGSMLSAMSINSDGWVVGPLHTPGGHSASLNQPTRGTLERLTAVVKFDRQVVRLGKVPAYAFVLPVRLHVYYAFNSDGTDQISVGYAANNARYQALTDVSTAGLKAANPTTGIGYDATEREAYAYYSAGGSAPTAGKALVVLEYYRAERIE